MRRRLLSFLVGAGVLGVGGTVWYWNRPTAPTPPPGLWGYADQSRHAQTLEGESVAFLDQGWTPAEATDFYFHTQGSRLLPYDWFLALEQPSATVAFADPRHLAGFGYLPQRPSRANPDGLPVGFACDPDRLGPGWVGFTCAACHTAELRYGTTAYRIDGGPGGGDLQVLLAALTSALRATLDDPAMFDRFAAAVGGDRDELRTRLADEVRHRERYEGLNRTPHPHGPARLDAFGRIVNTLLTDAVGAADDNARPPDAPVSYPFLWDAPHHDRVQWNGVARNRIQGSEQLGGLARNVGEVLGVFGRVTVADPGTALTVTGYRSSARIPDLLALEELLRKLQSPRWPDAFPPIDEAKRAAGAELFARHCSGCHADLDRADPGRTVAAVMTPVAEVGTDPRMAANFATRTGRTGKLEGRRQFFSAGERFGPTARADDVLVHVVVGAILGSPWKNYQRSGLTLVRDSQPAAGADDPLMAYKARPLNGIWATAPFLHNGSVPTLYDLLRPAAERPAVFRTGSRRFDPVAVGFEPVGPFEFDTRLPGNSNAGHEYGTRLTDEQRRQLVEYLKSL